MAKDNREPYQITINGIPHVTLLDPDDAERYGEAAIKVEVAASVEEPAPVRRTRKGVAADELNLVE